MEISRAESFINYVTSKKPMETWISKLSATELVGACSACLLLNPQ